jgi:hypothetical protein
MSPLQTRRGGSSGRGAEALVVPGDVASSESVAELGAAVASFGGADIFIHNAGIYPMETLAERDVRVMPARHGRQPRFDVPALQASEVGDKGVTVNALSPEVGGHREMGVYERSPALRGSSPTGCPPTSPALV